eukprot:6743149-Lingulodinium_polyedra.AAC.1
MWSNAHSFASTRAPRTAQRARTMKSRAHGARVRGAFCHAETANRAFDNLVVYRFGKCCARMWSNA